MHRNRNGDWGQERRSGRAPDTNRSTGSKQEGIRLEPDHFDELNFEIRDSVAIDVTLHEKVAANHAEPDGIGHRGIPSARTAQGGIDLDRIGFPVARMVAQANWGEFRRQP